MGNEGCRSLPGRTTASIPGIDLGDGHLLGRGSYELARIYGQDYLRMGIVGSSLSIESRRVEPEEDVGIDECVPFGWNDADPAGCQGRGGMGR